MKSLVVPLCAVLIGLGGPVVAQDTPIPRVPGDAAVVPVPGASGALAQHGAEVEVAFWESVKDSDDPMLFLAYLEQFPDGAFRVIARNRLNDLWDRALRAFALLEEMGVSVDTPPGSGVAPPPAPAPPPVVVTPAPAPAPPPVIVTPAPAPPPVIVRPASPSNPASLKTIRNTQNQLRKHGCYTGAVDGIWGDGSRKAMRKFNRRAGTSYAVAQPTFKALNHMRDLSKLGVRICR